VRIVPGTTASSHPESFRSVPVISVPSDVTSTALLAFQLSWRRNFAGCANEFKDRMINMARETMIILISNWLSV
jgi:hypothetical protein